MISIIVTTKNEEKHLPQLLASIKHQSFGNYEVIVIDNKSSDNTKKLALKWGARILDKGPERSAQRNYGVQKASGEYVLILDADMVLTQNVLRDCAGEIKNSKTEALIIPEKSFGKGPWIKYKVFEREFYLGDDSSEAPRFFRTSTFKKFGGYDRNITGPEDFDLPLRMRKAGVKIGRIKSFILHDEGNYSPFKAARKKFYYASHAGIFVKRHPEQVFTLGNLLFRPIFFKKWKKMITHPGLTFGMLVIKTIESAGAIIGAISSGII